MKKISYSEEELTQMGKDTSVCSVEGDGTKLWVSPLTPLDEIVPSPWRVLYPEDEIPDCNVRKTPPSVLSGLKFKAVLPEGKRGYARERCYQDAITAGAIGFKTIVSESAANKLAPYLGDECIFVPVNLDGAPQTYYIMWLTKIYDAVDEKRSMILDATYPGQKRAFNVSFFLKDIEAKYLFRAPGWKYTAGLLNKDLCLKAFRDLVLQLKLTGFCFYPAGTGLLMKLQSNSPKETKLVSSKAQDVENLADKTTLRNTTKSESILARISDEKEWDKISDLIFDGVQMLVDQRDWQQLESFNDALLKGVLTKKNIKKVVSHTNKLDVFREQITELLTLATAEAEKKPEVKGLYFEFVYDGGDSCSGDFFLCHGYSDNDNEWASEFEDVIEGMDISEYFSYDPDFEFPPSEDAVASYYASICLLRALAEVYFSSPCKYPLGFANHDWGTIIRLTR
jgi:hypothetical protein